MLRPGAGNKLSSKEWWACLRFAGSSRSWKNSGEESTFFIISSSSSASYECEGSVYVARFILEDHCRSLWVVEVVEELGLKTCERVVHRHGAILLIVKVFEKNSRVRCICLQVPDPRPIPVLAELLKLPHLPCLGRLDIIFKGGPFFLCAEWCWPVGGVVVVRVGFHVDIDETDGKLEEGACVEWGTWKSQCSRVTWHEVSNNDLRSWAIHAQSMLMGEKKCACVVYVHTSCTILISLSVLSLVPQLFVFCRLRLVRSLLHFRHLLRQSLHYDCKFQYFDLHFMLEIFNRSWSRGGRRVRHACKVPPDGEELGERTRQCGFDESESLSASAFVFHVPFFTISVPCCTLKTAALSLLCSFSWTLPPITLSLVSFFRSFSLWFCLCRLWCTVERLHQFVSDSSVSTFLPLLLFFCPLPSVPCSCLLVVLWEHFKTSSRHSCHRTLRYVCAIAQPHEEWNWSECHLFTGNDCVTRDVDCSRDKCVECVMFRMANLLKVEASGDDDNDGQDVCPDWLWNERVHRGDVQPQQRPSHVEDAMLGGRTTRIWLPPSDCTTVREVVADFESGGKAQPRGVWCQCVGLTGQWSQRVGLCVCHLSGHFLCFFLAARKRPWRAHIKQRQTKERRP